ncbi:transposase [Streptococcus sobrinus]|uniref:transposase n=1 Tax=Streptococcus sobrinus TaxID=1310 RepID=UPI00031BC0FB|nr:transposase [Streptococcus sobrinus]
MSQKYTKEFKDTIVQLHEAGQPVSDLVKEYGVANQTIYKWLQLYGKSGKSKAENVSLHELQQMRKEMAKMKEENEILKKALSEARLLFTVD